MQDFIHNLSWRGMIHDATPGIQEQLQKQLTSGYIGFDPTAPSFHIGNLASIMLLKFFQLSGHQPIAVIGGGTSLIGDPSGKKQERHALDQDILVYHQQCLVKQLQHLFPTIAGKRDLLIYNNYDWLKEYQFLDFLRDYGKHLGIREMLSKESVKLRLNQNTGLSFAEFSYQVLQAFDFYHLYITQHTILQMGGADQWGNLTLGLELIHKKTHQQAFALTTPLMTKQDGSKFGKTEEGTNIWLDPSFTSPYQFYQFWLNCSDLEAEKFIKIFTLLDQKTIEELIQTHTADPAKRILQKTLANEVTQFVHSQEAMQKAAQASTLLFGHTDGQALFTLDEQTLLEILAAIPQIVVSQEVLKNSNLVTLLSQATHGVIYTSKREACFEILQGAIHINTIKITDPYVPLDIPLLHEKYLLVQKGKKNYYLIMLGTNDQNA